MRSVCPYVFPWRRQGYVLLRSGTKDTVKATLRRLNMGVGIVRSHELRHTVTTHLERLGIAPHVISAVLNHSQRSFTLREYGHHDFEQEKAQALHAWADEIDRAIQGWIPGD